MNSVKGGNVRLRVLTILTVCLKKSNDVQSICKHLSRKGQTVHWWHFQQKSLTLKVHCLNLEKMESDTGLLMKTVETALQCTLASFSIVDSSLSLQIKLDKSNVFLDLLKSRIPRDESDVRVKLLEKNIFKNCDKCERVVPKKVSEIHLLIELNDAEAQCTECMDNNDVEARPTKIPVKGSHLICPVVSQRKQPLSEITVEADETNHESDSVLSNEDGTAPNKYFSCPDCGKVFTAIGYLNKHIKRQAISCKERAKNRMAIEIEKRQDQMNEAEDETNNESFSKTMVKVESEHSVSQNPVSKEEEILFHCEQCSVSFKTHYALQRHARGHRDQPFRCLICGKVFKSELYLTRHKKVHEHICKICGKMYRRPLLLSTHMLSHEDSSASKKKFSCKKCGRTFTALAYLRKHMKRQAISCRKERARSSSTTAGTERRLHSCQVCGSLYVTRAELRKHMDNHTEAERKACGTVSSRIRQKPNDGEILQPQTGKANSDKRSASLEDDEDVKIADSAGTSKESLKRCENLKLRVMKLEPNHSDGEDDKETSTAEVSGEKDSGGKHEEDDNAEFICQDDEDEPDNKPDGEKPKKSNEKKEYRCHFCNVSFSNRKSFNYHSRIIHAAVSTESSFLCHICGMAFSSQKNVDKHVQAKCAFSETEKQRCTVCNRVLTNSVALERHMLVHNGNRSIMCELCGKCFLNERSLKAHLAGHADHRPHKCDICGRRFRNIWHMKVHRKTHTGENLFQCPDCKDWFVNGSYLNNQHKRKYCKWRSKCSCDVCGRELQDRKHLESHMGYHSGERPYICEKCGKAFTKLANRDEHYNRHFDKFRFNCEHCNRGFKRQTDLRKHIKRHNGDQLQLRKYILPQHLKPKDVPQDVIITEQELDQATIIITEEPISEGMQISGEDIKLETPDVGTPVVTSLPSVLSSAHVTVTLPSSHTASSGEQITVVLPRELTECSQNISITESGEVLMVAMGPDDET